MPTQELLTLVLSLGAFLWVEDNKLILEGDENARATLRPLLQEHKPILLKHLSNLTEPKKQTAWMAASIDYNYEERAAIMEFDGGLSRKDAEEQAKLGAESSFTSQVVCTPALLC